MSDKMENKKSQDDKDRSKREIVRIGIALVFVLIIVFMVNVLSVDSDDDVATSTESLEAYILAEHGDDEFIQRIAYGHSSLSEADISIFEEDGMTAEELEYASAVIEYNDNQNVYTYTNGSLDSESPRTDEFTRRVPVIPYGSSYLPGMYNSMFYDENGEFDLSLEYLQGDIDYATIYYTDGDVDNPNKIVKTIRYVLPDTFPDVQAAVANMNIESTGGRIIDSLVDIDGVEYRVYEEVPVDDIEVEHTIPDDLDENADDVTSE